MADYSNFTLGGLGDDAEEKKAPDKSPFSGLSLSDITDEPQGAEQAPVVPSAEPESPQVEMPPVEAPQINLDLRGDNFSRPHVITSGDLDSDTNDVSNFILDLGPGIAKASSARAMGATTSEIGRRMNEAADDSKLFEAIAGGDTLDTIWETLKAISPVRMLGRLFPEELGAGGEELSKEGAAVFQEATKDLGTFSEKADTTGKQIAFDVISSAAATAPALATVPLKSPGLTLSALGATTYVDTTQQAIEKGQSVQKARLAGTIDGLVEAGTEMLPLGTLLRMGQGKSLLKDTIRFLAQEEGTELAATALQDLNAKLLYEPDMTAEEAINNLYRTAISTPFSAGLQVGGMRAVQGVEAGVNRVADKISGKIEERKSPAFTPFDEEVIQKAQDSEEARQKVRDLQTQMQEITDELVQEASKPTDEETLQQLDLQFGLADPKFTQVATDNTTTALESFLKPRDFYKQGKPTTFDQTVPGEVIVERPVNALPQMQSELDYLKNNPAHFAGMEESRQAQINALKEGIEKEKKAYRKQISILSRSQDTLQKLLQKYAPDLRLALIDSSGIRNSQGTAYTGSEGAAAIALNTRNLVSTSKRLQTSAEIPETLIHEFGHVLLKHTFAKQPQEVQQAIRNEWMDFLQKYAASTTDELNGLLQPSSALNIGEALPGQYMGELIKKNPDYFQKYLPNFAEFLAHHMVRTEGQSQEFQDFYKDARGTLKAMWEDLPLKSRHDETFQRYLNRLAKEQEIQAAERDYVRRVRMYRDGIRSMRHAAVTSAVDEFLGGVGGVVPPRGNGEWRGSWDRPTSINSSVDKFGKILNLFGGLTHVSEVNTHIPGVTAYRKQAEGLWQDKMRWTERAAQVVREWMNGQYIKGKQQREAFGKFIFEADRRSEELGRKLTQQELVELAQETGMPEEGMKLANRVWGTFAEALDEVEAVTIAELEKQLLAGDTVTASKAIQQVRKDFAAMRNRNYMPHSRFGSYTITGYAQRSMTDPEGNLHKKGSIVYFGTYATEQEALKAQKRLKQEYRGANFGVGRLNDTTKELLDLPPALANIIESRLQLTDVQSKELTEIRAMLAPGQSFRKRFLQRDSVQGYSNDALRVYADYMQKFAGHLARLKHIPAMQESIQAMQDSARNIRQQGGNSVKRENLIKWFEDHMEYMINPGNELASLRAMGFIYYLGFNVKSAMVNATQVPFVAYPYLAAKYNDISATAALTEAMYKVTKAQFKKTGIDKDTVDMIDTLVRRGIIDESLATELAALSEGGFLSRNTGGTAERLGIATPENTIRMQKFFESGALMFQAVEKLNRRIVAVATYNLARKKGRSHDQAIDDAHEAIIQTQFEYGRINRPRAMRGAVGANVFMFWQYMTNMLFFLGRNKTAAARYMIIMFFMTGLQGLPFAENILDVLDLAIKKLKEYANWEDPKKGAREYIMDFVRQLDDDPMLGDFIDTHTVMNGAASNIFGLYDMSASLSMGRIVPATEYMTTDLDPNTELLGTMGQLSGAMVNIPISIYQATFSDKPDTWKNVERALPSSAAGLSAAMRYAVRGEEVDSSGAAIYNFDWPDDIKSWAQITGRALGFSLSEINREREKNFQAYDALQYYTRRHTALTSMLNYAYATENPDMQTEAFNRIADFNKQVPYPEMMIQTQSIVQSLREGQKRRMMRELGLPEQKKYYRYQFEVEDRYENKGD